MKCVKGLGFLWVAVLAAFFALSACDDSSSASSDETGTSSSSVESPDSSVTLSGASAESNGSSNENMEKDKSSSSVKGSEPAEVSSSSAKETKNSSDSKSSSSVKTGGSSSSNKDKSSSSVSLSSSEITDYVGLPCEGILSDGNTGKIYLCVDGRYVLYVPTESSSSGPYEPFDQTLPLKKFEEERYKTFTDSRNDRVYYYLTIMGKDEDGVKDTIDVMAQNLNIADVTLKAGENMTDDTKIERYCYNDDTTKCDRYGGLYQWAEMMGFNDSCNTKSCADLIQPNHQGICPKGWRLMTRHDFEVARSSTEYGVHGLRSEYIFTGNNESGLSLTGAGAYFNQRGFADLDSAFYMFYPSESVFQDKVLALGQVISRYTDGSGTARGSKFDAFSVRCVKK
ncbi:major paralogous domain-containing protein [Fibrobacter sp. UWOV1]|uniref:FISUMP domain-containing protein n=1 Tax=Fibrobacter sp. UWOV1 TaxID=1896215 RepID=UPI00091EC5CF|nr:FISUMP domain-containing protein [Fibrobacter sp. UWOV1]SHK39515.1 major paralogous domain-containing protein [Fibrobacter sp. UWOV1]